MLQIFNTLDKKKELFNPLHKGEVKMYVCGITPYDHAHIGHARVYVFFDLVVRTLQLLGYNVTYCRNYTDIDDKLLKKSQERFSDPMRYQEIVAEVIASFTAQMRALNCETPTYEPRVTEHIPQIIDFIEGLVKAGRAYVVKGDVYYSIQTFPAYGKLSGQKIDELRAGARIEVDEDKRDPLDFALWKSEPEGMFWKSPWGYGRPGWHIECSALARQYLGKKIDIHGGGMDLMFPHHENEVAQTEGLTGDIFARYWLHNAFVRVDKEKMSKSLGNMFGIAQALEAYDPMVLRYYLLSHHYRAPLDFSHDELASVQKGYEKIIRTFADVTTKKIYTLQELQEVPALKKMIDFLVDDFNTSGMLGVLFEHMKELAADKTTASKTVYFIHQVLGFTLKPLAKETIIVTPEIKKLLDERMAARAAKDWARADALRDQLQALGFEVKDTRG
jgi:cysteinyl-tRNA synthetase